MEVAANSITSKNVKVFFIKKKCNYSDFRISATHCKICSNHYVGQSKIVFQYVGMDIVAIGAPVLVTIIRQCSMCTVSKSAKNFSKNIRTIQIPITILGLLRDNIFQLPRAYKLDIFESK